MTRETAMAPRLWRADVLEGFTLGAADGDIGRIEDLYFDDQTWTVRYLVLDTSKWLPGRRVLISPASIGDVDPVGMRLVTGLTKDQVEHSPGVDTAMPVSRRHEARLLTYYGLPFYWRGPYRWGPTRVPRATDQRGAGQDAPGADSHERPDLHLRSARTVRSFGIRATDGDLGRVEDFLVDDDAWAIRYLVADTRAWWPGVAVLVATEWITDVGWEDSRVHVGVTREAVRGAPRYEAGPIDREFEARLHAHYRRRGYWERPPQTWTLL
jgi:hypothetical protein